MTAQTLSTLDLGVLVVYLVASIGLGIWLGRGNQGSDDYFLAGRRMGWFPIGASLYASNISTTTLIGLAGAAYTYGIVFYNYEWMAAVVLAIFAVWFLPVVVRARLYTMPEFLERRFSRASRTYLALVTLFLNIVVDTAGSLYAGALLFQVALPDVPLWAIVVVLALAAGLYTVVGGLSAVMVTDTIQAVVLTAAAAVVAAFAFSEAGGYTAVMETVARDHPQHLHLIKPIDDEIMPWPTLVFGVPVLGFYFWCTNQFMTQRVLSARSVEDGQWGVLFAGLLKLPTLFLMVLPGIAAIVLYPDLETGDQVYARLLFDLLPAGMLGLALAGFVAALMSQIDSTLHSASTIVTMDFVHRSNPDLSPHQLMRVGQVATVVFMILAVLWAPQIERFASVFQYLQDTLAFLVGPIVALFAFGVLWPRANTVGAHAAIAAGLVCSAALFVAKATGASTMNNLYAAPITLMVASAALVLGSLATEAPSEASIAGLTYTEEPAAQGLPVWQQYRVQAVVLLVLTAGVVGWFA